jgi:hypothetical protein
MIAVIIILGLIATGLGFGLFATASAPLGYQDEAGFHFGQNEGASEDQFAYRVPEPKLA